jgi:hypothetical protein
MGLDTKTYWLTASCNVTLTLTFGTQFSSEKKLHKDYDLKGSVEKISALSLKLLRAETNWLAVNSQS